MNGADLENDYDCFVAVICIILNSHSYFSCSFCCYDYYCDCGHEDLSLLSIAPEFCFEYNCVSLQLPFGVPVSYTHCYYCCKLHYGNTIVFVVFQRLHTILTIIFHAPLDDCPKNQKILAVVIVRMIFASLCSCGCKERLRKTPSRPSGRSSVAAQPPGTQAL